MRDTILPAPVQSFVADLREYLRLRHASLVEARDDPPDVIGRRVFRIPEAALPATLVLQPALRAQEFPDYRLCISVTLPEDQRPMIARRRRDANRLSMFGAVHAEGRAVRSQALVSAAPSQVLAPVATAALMYAGNFLLAGLRQTETSSFWDRLRGKARRPPRLDTPTAWSDAEMEQIHYDHAHIGGSLEAGIWRLPLGNGAALSLSPVEGYPLFGGGLLMELRMPRETFLVGSRQVSVDELNTLAYHQSDVPIFGSWSEDARGYSFRSFAPNPLERVYCLAEHYLDWGLQLAQQARWLAEQCPRLTRGG